MSYEVHRVLTRGLERVSPQLRFLSSFRSNEINLAMISPLHGSVSGSDHTLADRMGSQDPHEFCYASKEGRVFGIRNEHEPATVA